MMAFPLSLAALTILDAGPAGQIRAGAAAGFRSVGLRLMPLLPSDAPIVGDPAAEAEIEQLLIDNAMTVLEVGVFRIAAEIDWDAVSAVLAYSGGIGARFIVCPVEDPDGERAAATLAALGRRSRQEDLRALVEFNPYSACPTLADAVALVERARAIEPLSDPGLVIDALHLSRSGGNPSDLATVDPHLLALLHLCDAAPPPRGARSLEALREESRMARRLPGEGSLWLAPLIAALPAEIAISIEAPNARDAHLPASARAARALTATTDFLARIGSAP